MPSIYEWEFDSAVPEKFPWNKYKVLRDSYYEEGLNFLKNFNGYEKCKILGIEQEFEIEIDDWNLVGFIDVVFVDESGKLIVRDYKSKASFKNETEKKNTQDSRICIRYMSKRNMEDIQMRSSS